MSIESAEALVKPSAVSAIKLDDEEARIMRCVFDLGSRHWGSDSRQGQIVARIAAQLGLAEETWRK